MQQKKFVTNIAFLIVLNLLIKPFWPLGIEIQVQNQVGNAAYGEYAILFSFSFLLNILLDFGVTQFNNKNIAQNNHLLTKHFSSLFSLKLVLGLIYFIVTMIFGLVMGYDFRFMKLLALLAVNQFLISMILYLRSSLLGLHLFKTDSFVSVADRVIMIAICLVLLLRWFGLEIDIMKFVYAQTIGYLITAIIAFATVYAKTDHFKLKWNWPFSYMILKQSFPFAILFLLMTFYNRLDTVMLGNFLPTVEGAEQAGIYAKAFRLLEAGNMISYLFSVQLIAVFSRMIKHKENVEHIVKLSFILLIAPALVVSFGCFFYNVEISGLINHGITDSAREFGILMFCFSAQAATYIFGTLLTANGNFKQLNTMAFIGICINLILNFILIPHYKALGCAISSLITQSLTAIIQIYFAYKIFNFKVNVRLLIALGVFIIGIIALNIFSKSISPNWLINFALMTISCVIWAFVSGLLNIKSIFRFIKYQ